MYEKSTRAATAAHSHRTRWGRGR